MQVACDGYTWIDDNTYTTSNNTATHIVLNSAGCDSIVTLDLTISASTPGTDVQTACNSYTWIDGNTYTSSNNTATHTLTNASGCDSIVTLDLTINTIDVSVTSNDPILVAGATGVSYQWMNCSDSTIISNETNQSFTAAANGEYAVIVSDGNCSDTSECMSVTTVGITSLSTFANIVVYPNPSNNGLFKVNLGELYETIDQIHLSNALGQLIVDVFKPTNDELTIEVPHSGVYLLSIETNKGEHYTIRLVHR